MSGLYKLSGMSLDEDNVRRDLSEWIHDKTGANVYWGEDPNDEYGRFTFTGNGRPDLLAEATSDDGLTVVAELKDGTESGDIYSSMTELHDYWRQYEYDDATVEVDGEEIDIDVFVLANRHSPDGHLFKHYPDDNGLNGDDREKGIRRTYTSPVEGKRSEGPDTRPKYAYARSEIMPLILARYARYEAERQQGDEYAMNTGIGVLLSSALNTSPDQSGFGEFGDSDEPTTTPYVHWYDGEGYDGDKNPLWMPL